MFHDVKINDKGMVWNTDLIETLELENLLRNFDTIQCKQVKQYTLPSTGQSPEGLMLAMITPIVTMSNS